MLLLALALAPFSPWGSFSREPMLNHAAEVVEIETRGVEGKRPRFVLRLTRTALRSRQVRWADSARCPAVRVALAGLHDLRSPQVAPPGSGDEATTIVLDGTAYELRMPAAFGADQAAVTMSSNSDTPLARWIDGALAMLAPCWTAEPPES